MLSRDLTSEHPNGWLPKSRVSLRHLCVPMTQLRKHPEGRPTFFLIVPSFEEQMVFCTSMTRMKTLGICLCFPDVVLVLLHPFLPYALVGLGQGTKISEVQARTEPFGSLIGAFLNGPGASRMPTDC